MLGANALPPKGEPEKLIAYCFLIFLSFLGAAHPKPARDAEKLAGAQAKKETDLKRVLRTELETAKRAWHEKSKRAWLEERDGLVQAEAPKWGADKRPTSASEVTLAEAAEGAIPSRETDATWIYHIDMPHGYTTWICHTDIPHGCHSRM